MPVRDKPLGSRKFGQIDLAWPVRAAQNARDSSDESGDVDW